MTTPLSKSPACVENIKTLGDFWTLRIIDALREKALRYTEIQAEVRGISPATLTSRLKKLENAQIIHRVEESRAEVNYSLTALGEHVLPVLDALIEFSSYTERPQQQ